MKNYIFFGQLIKSKIDFPGIEPLISSIKYKNPIYVKFGKTPRKLVNPPTIEKPFSIFNDLEFLYTFPNVAKYYVRNGNQIIIEPLVENENDALLFFYSSALAIVLFQRNLIPFHASGVKINQNKIVLFPAPSGMGKSTTALFLEKKGYPIFSDDTVLLEIIDGKCFATPSYPIMRLWQNTLQMSKYYQSNNTYELRPGLKKYGIYLNENFTHTKMEVAAIVFLNNHDQELKIKPLIQKDAFIRLLDNVYGKQWINPMNKHLLQFQLASLISQSVRGFLANRPKGIDSFLEFSDAIENEVISKINDKKK